MEKNLKRIKIKEKMYVSRDGRAVLLITIGLRLCLCPWYFECVVMCAQYVCRQLVGAETEAGLLV